jgi:hypothetical protein
VIASLAETLAARAEAERHLFALFPGDLPAGEFLELRCLDCSVQPARKGPRRYFRSRTDLATAAIRLREDWDVFVGVGLRRCPATDEIARCPHETRGADHVSRLPAAWADLDVACEDEPDKPHASLDAVLGMLDNAELPPSLVIGSGVGAHAYWTLPEPTAELARVEALNRALRDRLRGDNAIDAGRILRLSGTYNFKHGRPLPVRLLRGPR